MIRAFLRARAHGAITRLANVLRRAASYCAAPDLVGFACLAPNVIDLNHRAAGRAVA